MLAEKRDEIVVVEGGLEVHTQEQVGLNWDPCSLKLPLDAMISAFMSLTWCKCEPKPALDDRDIENLKNGHPLGM